MGLNEDRLPSRETKKSSQEKIKGQKGTIKRKTFYLDTQLFKKVKLLAVEKEINISDLASEAFKNLLKKYNK